MTITPPTATDLLVAPELAILAALEFALMASVEAVMARHPELRDDFDFCESGLGTEAALALRVQAVALAATVNRYRLSLVVPGDEDI